MLNHTDQYSFGRDRRATPADHGSTSNASSAGYNRPKQIAHVTLEAVLHPDTSTEYLIDQAKLGDWRYQILDEVDIIGGVDFITSLC